MLRLQLPEEPLPAALAPEEATPVAAVSPEEPVAAQEPVAAEDPVVAEEPVVAAEPEAKAEATPEKNGVLDRFTWPKIRIDR